MAWLEKCTACICVNEKFILREGYGLGLIANQICHHGHNKVVRTKGSQGKLLPYAIV